jgi:hypothetical protein
MHWLTWLARQMKQHNQTIFYIEHLQPDCLTGERMHRAYDRWALRFPAILMGILVSLAISLFLAPGGFFSLSELAIFFAPNIVLGGVIGWLLGTGSTTQQPHESSGKARRGSWSRLVERLRVGVLIGLASGLYVGLIYGLASGLGIGLIYGLIYGLIAGLSGGLLSVLLIGKPVGITLTDELVWSWRSLGRSLFAKRHLATTLRVMAFVGLYFGLYTGLLVGLSFGLASVLGYGLSTGLGFWLLFGLLHGVSSETIGDQRRVVPNQGIRRSARNSLILGLIGTGIAGLSAGLSAGLTSWLAYGVRYGLG